MDPGTIIGIISAVIMLAGSIIIAEGALYGFVDVPALIIIAGGTFCGVLIAFPMRDVLRLPVLFRKVLFSRPKEAAPVIDQIVSLAETARHDGILALESRLDTVSEPFLASALRLVVDGLPPDTVEAVLRRDMKSTHLRHTAGRRLFSQLGRTAPMFGLMSTLMGLVMMLADMNPLTVGRHMSIALLGTFYGTVLANLLFLPAAEKLNGYNANELEIMELIMAGIRGIQCGDNPSMIRRNLSTFLPQKQRAELDGTEE
ncbi:MAG: MotA/TolQ/ExbB proton channel family protein [Planctomycetaceae bacterium]|jgi:chemotaxis protein MotA|nr:MotA/TolQ/ExbB proton channel family protein [Planctomycetaceae bacterium]